MENIGSQQVISYPTLEALRSEDHRDGLFVGAFTDVVGDVGPEHDELSGRQYC
jgi:hypothetical protein